jgi:hypothetical protein
MPQVMGEKPQKKHLFGGQNYLTGETNCNSNNIISRLFTFQNDSQSQNGNGPQKTRRGAIKKPAHKINLLNSFDARSTLERDKLHGPLSY